MRKLWRIFDWPLWKKYKEIAAIRGLVNWVGGSGIAMAVITGFGSFLWAKFVSVPAPLRFLVGAVSLVVVGSLFALVRYLFGSDPPPAKPAKSIVTDPRGVQYDLTSAETAPKRRRWARVAASLIVVVLACLAHFAGWLNALAAHLRTPPIDPGIFMECDMVPLPLAVPNDGLRVIPINKKKIQSQTHGWEGFYEVTGGPKWPDESLMNKARDLKDLGFCYKCRVSNHGPLNIMYVGIRIGLWFGNAGGEKNKIRYTPVISAIDSGGYTDFYLVNDCNVNAAAVWENRATVQVLGESETREINIRRTYKSPMDQIMMLFPTQVRWMNAYPCE